MPPSPPPHSNNFLVAFPIPHVLLLTLNRPEALNSVTPQQQQELRLVLDWFDVTDELWVLVITGAERMFCTGVDLKDWNQRASANTRTDQTDIVANTNGFASLSRRDSAKPIIAAVNGGAFGGGMELLLNCDLVVAADDAKFALPEVRRGVSALQGGIPRLTQIAGHQRASEMLLLGRTFSAKEAYAKFGFINFLVPQSSVLSTALDLAKEIVTKCSPDAVQATKRALLLAEDHQASIAGGASSRESDGLFGTEGDALNMQEGLLSFVEKRAPVWKNPRSKL
ncbi:ClpP/crotonase [Cylindrobasidium torrendii FP15055 ss-10]|uniref:ClpP/crotonase n=1 Tax=Cylindrobasidium torrendii FP15055 ss-10 TaxID=1314674 RepID=A0A0D7BMA0_9AGAR|nr:ClpP/crotonase [Cylindrobasidium torrendii FP15055 ss-10]